MVARIRLEAEDATKAAFDSASQNARRTQNAIDGVSESMDQAGSASSALSADLNAVDATLQELEREFSELKGALNELEKEQGEVSRESQEAADHFRHMGDEARRAGEKIESVDNSSARFLSTMAKLWALKEVFTKVAQGIDYLAEKGNPAFRELRDKATELRTEAEKLAESRGAQMIAGQLTEATEKVGGFGLAVGNTASGIYDFGNTVVAYYAELIRSFGDVQDAGVKAVVEQGRQQMFARKALAEEQEKDIERKRRDFQVATQRTELEKIGTDLEKYRQEQRELSDIKKTETAEAVDKLQQAELTRMKDLTDRGKFTADMQKELAERLIVLEQRKAEIIQKTEDDRKEAEKKIADDKKAAAEKDLEYRKEQQKRSKEIEEEMQKQDLEIFMKTQEEKEAAAKELQEKLAQGRYDAQKQELADAHEHANRLRAAYDKQVDAGKVPGLDLDKFGGGVSSRKRVTKFYVDQKEDQAGDAIQDAFDAKTDEEKYGKYSNIHVKEQRDREIQREVRKAREDARRQAAKDVKSGAADEDLYRIQGDFANAFITQEASNGKLSKESVQAMREGIQVIQQQQQQTEQLNREVDEIRRVVAGMGDRNNRKTAQRRVN